MRARFFTTRHLHDKLDVLVSTKKGELNIGKNGQEGDRVENGERSCDGYRDIENGTRDKSKNALSILTSFHSSALLLVEALL